MAYILFIAFVILTPVLFRTLLVSSFMHKHFTQLTHLCTHIKARFLDIMLQVALHTINVISWRLLRHKEYV